MNTEVENNSSSNIEINKKHNVTIKTGADVELKKSDYEVAVQVKEYKVVGDNIYIPRLYDDAPQWMKDIIGTIVDVKTAIAVGNLNDALEALRTLATELEVAKNTYTMSIVSSNDIDTRINTAIETLNSSLLDADATIMNIAQTATTPEEATVIATNILSASFGDNGAIGSFINNMNSAFANLDSSTAQSIAFMESAIDAEFQANAQVINTIRTYVGVDEAGASTGTGLSGYLEGSDGTIGGADSQLVNDIKLNAEIVESKFEYNSSLNINGTTYNSGFGLATSLTAGSGLPVGQSEFWIKADKFKLMSADGSIKSSYSPFVVNTSTGDITFNGKVAFSNVTGYTAPDISGTINNNNDIFAQKLGYANYAAMVAAASSGQTIINGGYLRTTLIQADSIMANQINTTGLIAENISANEIVGKTITGGIINGAVINGSVVKTSYLDLDGDLEVLTEYHLSTSQSQLDAHLASGGYGRLVLEADKIENDGDATYITASNEYRIPTLSSISEPIQTFTGRGTKTLIGKVCSFNNTSAGHNIKSRKIRPTISVATQSIIYSASSLGLNASLGYNGGYYPLLPNNPNFSNGNGTLVEIWFGGVLLIRFGSYYPYDITHRCYIYDALTQTYVDGGVYLTYSPTQLNKTLTLNTSTFDVMLHYTRGYSQSCTGEECIESSSGSLTMSILPKTFEIPFDFTSGNLEIRSVYTSISQQWWNPESGFDFTLKIPSGISINNMI